MATPLAWLNLAHNKTRTAVAVAGVAFSIVLIFMQLGFLGATKETATILYDSLDFDIAIRSPEYLHVADSRSFPTARLRQVAAVPGVRSAVPFYVAVNQWRNPGNGRGRAILVMGVQPADSVFQLPELREKISLLSREDLLLIDRKSRKDFGPKNGRQFSDQDVGVEAEVGRKRVRIAGHFGLGTGLAADGAVVLSERGFLRVFSGRNADRVNLGLVNVGDADIDEMVARLDEALPDDVAVLSRSEVVRRETDHWVNQTSIGLIFKLGVVVALIVGMAIVYQVLTSDVDSHLGEYATLKAMGYGNGYLAGVVLQQAVMLALLGFVPGLLLSELLYRITSYFANIPVEMNVPRILFVLAMSIGMCALSGLGALRKVWSADPADLF